MLQCGVPVCGVLGGVGVPTARDGCGRLCGTGDVAEVVSGAVVVVALHLGVRCKKYPGCVGYAVAVGVVPT